MAEREAFFDRFFSNKGRENNGPVSNPSEVGAMPPEIAYVEMGKFVPGRSRPAELSGFKLVQSIGTDGKAGWLYIPVKQAPLNCCRTNPHGGGNEVVCGGSSKDARRTVKSDRRHGR
jgi:hypothetical protein